MCQGGLFPSYRLKVTSKSEASLKSKGQGRSYLWTVWLIRDDPIGIHPAPSPTRHPCDDKPGELHMGPGLCKWPKSSLVPPNSILQALAQLDPHDISSANLGLPIFDKWHAASVIWLAVISLSLKVSNLCL